MRALWRSGKWRRLKSNSAMKRAKHVVLLQNVRLEKVPAASRHRQNQELPRPDLTRTEASRLLAGNIPHDRAGVVVQTSDLKDHVQGVHGGLRTGKI